MFDVPEEDSESVDSKVAGMLEHLEKKPKVSACQRIGKRKALAWLL